MKLNRTRAVVFTLATALLLPWIGRTLFSAEPEEKPFEPVVGQGGKDVIWVPTTDPLVAKMLDLTKVTDKDYVIDLGSGDGRIVIAAAKLQGPARWGSSTSRRWSRLSKKNAEKAGVAAKATFKKADLFETDFSKATVVTLYLLPELNLEAAAEDPQDETGHARCLRTTSTWAIGRTTRRPPWMTARSITGSSPPTCRAVGRLRPPAATPN